MKKQNTLLFSGVGLIGIYTILTRLTPANNFISGFIPGVLLGAGIGLTILGILFQRGLLTKVREWKLNSIKKLVK